jgi:hypothetical protein
VESPEPQSGAGDRWHGWRLGSSWQQQQQQQPWQQQQQQQQQAVYLVVPTAAYVFCASS